MENVTLMHRSFILIVPVAALLMTGCGSSEEAAKQEPPSPAMLVLQNEANSLKIENSALKDRIARMEQENRASTAHAAELETQLAELKERLAAPPPPPPAAKVNPANARGAYDQALHLFHGRNYAQAAATFQGILDGGTAGSLESNCHYWLGECAYATKNYQEAVTHFQKVFGFARSAKKDDAQLMIAHSYYAIGDKAKAKAEYQKLVDKYPASPYAKRAKARLGTL